MNPFRYGNIVSGEYFYDREVILSSLKSDIKSGNNLIIYAPRRYGKTSLIMKLLSELESEGMNVVYLDFFNVINLDKFVELYSLKILKARKNISFEKLLKEFRTFVKSIIPSVSFDDAGHPAFSLSYSGKRNPSLTFEEVINLPDNLPGKKKWVVVFDEFQEINKLNGQSFEKQLRANIQHHKNVSYIFMGSKTHMLLNMFRDKSRAFYNIGKYIKIEKIPEPDSIDFLITKFKGSGISLSEKGAHKILEYAQGIPYYIQFIASEVWQNSIGKKSVNIPVIESAVDRIIYSQQDFYREIFGTLSVYQKQVLYALAISGKNIFSKEYADANNLSSPSSSQRAIEKLLKEGIIEKSENEFVFSDPFFSKWLLINNLS